MKRSIKYLIAVGFFAFATSCGDSLLEEEVFNQLGPSNFYQTEADAVSLLTSVYQYSQRQGDESQRIMLANELPTDLLIDRGGGLERLLKPYEEFTWNSTDVYLIVNIWNWEYTLISRANLAIQQIPLIESVEEATRNQLVAEARFLRALAYLYLEDLYGPVPLVTSGEADPNERPARATQEEMDRFIQTEFREAADALPVTQELYGRASKGAALAMLMRYQLNHRNWQAVVDLSSEIIGLGVYALFEADNRTDLFKIENEVNSEFIWARPYLPAQGQGMIFLPRAAPPQYQFKFPPKANFATNYRIYSSFYDSFEEGDQRRDALITEYVNTDGDTIQLGEDDIRTFKYQEDPNGLDRWAGNDMPVIRYADVLLARAEALNELNGPNQEAINLINQVRTKAGLPDLVLTDFGSADALNEHILKERGWEFFNEEIRRQDLIRHEVFISGAQERGFAAQAYHVKFPIPQEELDLNPNLEQNSGYAQ